MHGMQIAAIPIFFFLSYYFFGIFVFFCLCRPSEANLQLSCQPCWLPNKEWHVPAGWRDAGFKPRTAGFTAWCTTIEPPHPPNWATTSPNPNKWINVKSANYFNSALERTIIFPLTWLRDLRWLAYSIFPMLRIEGIIFNWYLKLSTASRSFRCLL